MGLKAQPALILSGIQNGKHAPPIDIVHAGRRIVHTAAVHSHGTFYVHMGHARQPDTQLFQIIRPTVVGVGAVVFDLQPGQFT